MGEAYSSADRHFTALGLQGCAVQGLTVRDRFTEGIDAAKEALQMVEKARGPA